MNTNPSPALLEINSRWHHNSRPWAEQVTGELSGWFCHCPSCEHRGEMTTLVDAMNQAIVHHYKCGEENPTPLRPSVSYFD